MQDRCSLLYFNQIFFFSATSIVEDVSCLLITLDFSSAISGTLLDKDGQGTGFTSVQPNTADNAYDLGRIDLNTAASTLYPQPPTQADGNIQVLT